MYFETLRDRRRPTKEEMEEFRKKRLRQEIANAIVKTDGVPEEIQDVVKKIVEEEQKESRESRKPLEEEE